MATENENQNIPIPSKEPEAPSKENTPKTCVTCEVAIGANDIRLQCKYDQCGAVTCNSCTKLMVEVMFGQPVLEYPLKCCSCANAYDSIEVDQLLAKHASYEQYIAFILPLFWSKDCLEQNENLAQCPFCPYVEIHTTDACPIQFMTCQHPTCGKRSCLICLHEITDDESNHRTICVELQSHKEMVEKAIETGSKQQCPHCHLTGLKDDGCTHMTCERCGLTWCYLCGMKETECLVGDDDDPSFSAHNNEWEQHEGRCPMSLVSIHELDNRWPDDDAGCLEFFHRYRTLCELYDVMKIVGEDRFDELNQTFGVIDASGYTIDEIKDYDNRMLINYGASE